MGRRSTLEEFIKKAQQLHGNTYLYNKSIYINNSTKMTITCKKHGDFEQTPNAHLQNKGCLLCSRKNETSNTKTFILSAKVVHKNRYKYTKVDYVGALKKVTITCKKHGDFEQIPNKHLRGSNCPRCVLEDRLIPREEFIRRAKEVHTDKYTYAKKYKNMNTKVFITCKKHGKFEQLPASHLQGQGCPECGGSKKDNTKSFIDKARLIHGNTYKYTKVDYVDTLTHVSVTCKKHGDFLTIPNNHLRGSGCSKCANHWFNASKP